MALSDDQKALLRLLAQREQGYDDIAALKGLSVEQVRAEVREALAEIDTPPPEPPRPPEPTPPAPDPPAPAPQERMPEPSPPEPKKAASKSPRSGQQAPIERRRLLLFAGGALAIVAIALGAIALLGDGSDSGAGGESGIAGAGTDVAAGDEGKVTQAVLTSPDGGDATGRAVFGRLGQEEIVLQVTGENLEPSEKSAPYTVWLYRNPKLSLRVGTVQVGESGELGARFPIPAELLAYVAGGAFDQVYVSRTPNAAYQREVARAKREKAIPRYVGETVLTGKITGPIAKEAANQGN